MTFTGSSAVYQVADNLGAPHIKYLARQAGVISVLRITAYYPERKIRHSVATLIERIQNQRQMSIIHEGFYNHQPVTLTISREGFEKVLDALLQNRFDRLTDQPGISYKDHCLWLIQRASGTYTHSVIASPDHPILPYAAIVNAIDAYLPEAIREIPLT